MPGQHLFYVLTFYVTALGEPVPNGVHPLLHNVETREYLHVKRFAKLPNAVTICTSNEHQLIAAHHVSLATDIKYISKLLNIGHTFRH